MKFKDFIKNENDNKIDIDTDEYEEDFSEDSNDEYNSDETDFNDEGDGSNEGKKTFDMQAFLISKLKNPYILFIVLSTLIAFIWKMWNIHKLNNIENYFENR